RLKGKNGMADPKIPDIDALPVHPILQTLASKDSWVRVVFYGKHPPTKAEQDLINEAARILRNMDQYYIDIEYWNELHPNEQPIDPDDDGGQMRRMRDAYRKGLEREAAMGNFPNNNLAPARRRTSIPMLMSADEARETLKEGGLTGHGQN